MSGSSTVSCSNCGANVDRTLELCPRCGGEVGGADAARTDRDVNRTSGAVDRTSGNADESDSELISKPTNDGIGGDESTATLTEQSGQTGESAPVEDGGGSGFGFIVGTGLFGLLFLLAPMFLTDFSVPFLLALVGIGADAGGVSMLPAYGFGVLLTVLIACLAGLLCLSGATMRLLGVSTGFAKLLALLGIGAGTVGLIGIFVF